VPDPLSTFARALDLAGTFAFALSGAAAGMKHRLDLFGVLVLSFVAATFGGIMRDVLIGAVPPAAIRDWPYLTVSVVAGLVSFFAFSATRRIGRLVLVFDAVGLALAAVAGTAKALTFHLGPVAAALLGMLSGIGGGLIRDVLVAEVPAVFQSEIYALAALAGAATVVIGGILGLPVAATSSVAAVVCVGLRIVAIRRGWRLPVAG
jgi:uncharacterized membrane protein YeiH